jgi:O-6-methylguanine DNA methyltransferase
MPNAKWGFFHTRLGWSAAAWTSQGLSGLALPRKNREKVLRALHGSLPHLSAKFWEKPLDSVPKAVRIQARKALNGRRFQFSKFDISFLTLFQQKILRATSQIPWGQVRSYAWVAKKAGCSKGFRAAGQALNRNPIPIFIPCHRVIAAGGRIGGFGAGLEWKKRLLLLEGVTVNEGLVNSYRGTKL